VARVFLDANVLFSAAYREDSALVRLWRVSSAVLVSSEYAVDEARRNLPDAAARARLERMLADVEIVTGMHDALLADGLDLAEKDRPILGAALAAGCTHLITGDSRHFGRLFGSQISGLHVMTPAMFLSATQ